MREEKNNIKKKVMGDMRGEEMSERDSFIHSFTSMLCKCIQQIQHWMSWMELTTARMRRTQPQLNHNRKTKQAETVR